MSIETTTNDVHNGSDKPKFDEKLQTLIDGSIRLNFDAIKDIPWNHPDYAMDPMHPGWELPSHIDIGEHEWYQNLPDERKREVGMRRMINIAKVGPHFERPLVMAIQAYNMEQPSGSLRMKYSDLEAREEVNHIRMFEELVDRSGLDVEGTRAMFRKLVPLLTPLGAKIPAGMWTVVLAGEEPIDHLQKELLRNSDDLHPAMRDVMAIHVAEEARHISFAHEYLEENVPKLSLGHQAVLAAATPAAMRTLANAIMRPSPGELRAMGIPKKVADEIWFDSPQGKHLLSGLFPDARMLAEKTGLKTPEGGKRTIVSSIGDTAWKAFGINGRASRYRSEPDRTHNLSRTADFNAESHNDLLDTVEY